MKISNFKEATAVFAKDQKEYLPLPAYVDRSDPQGCITCLWKLTLLERLALLWTGKIWQQILTFNKPLQPQKLSIVKPIMKVL